MFKILKQIVRYICPFIRFWGFGETPIYDYVQLIYIHKVSIHNHSVKENKKNGIVFMF